MTLVTDRAGTGPRIVLVHGALSNRRVWGYQLLDLSRQFDVAAVDLPGHGDSAWATSADWFADAIDALAANPAVADPGPITLIGWSIGAAVASEVARDRRDTRLVIAGATTVDRTDTERAALERQAGGDFARFAATTARRFSATSSSDADDWLAGLALGNRIDASIAALVTARPVGDVPADTVVVHGAWDMITPPEQRPATTHDHVVDRAGHAVFLDDRRAFDDLVARIALEEPSPA